MNTPKDMDKDIKPIEGASCQNKRGEWVPVIEEPYTHLIRFECRCGKKFWTRYGYDSHYALRHILAL